MNGLLVNPLGEVYRHKDCLISSVNVTEVAVKTLNPRQLQVWRRYQTTKPGWQKLDKLVQAGIEREFDELARQRLTRRERSFYLRVSSLQKLNNDRFRIYGRLGADRRNIWLVTEFIGLVGNRDLWKRIRKLVTTTRAVESRCMFQEPRMDLYWPPKLVPGETYVTCDGQHWAAGSTHGKLERQVEIRWDIARLSKLQVKSLLTWLKVETEELWKEAGVSVL